MANSIAVFEAGGVNPGIERGGANGVLQMPMAKVYKVSVDSYEDVLFSHYTLPSLLVWRRLPTDQVDQDRQGVSIERRKYLPAHEPDRF